MLRRLHIRDFVIVDRLELEFGPGFGALTGETGAGKSILVDALSLALGERADGPVVRAGAERAEVAAEFELAPTGPLGAWLRANDLEADGCLLRRVIEAGGRSRAYINGAPATLAQLREAAAFLADIHGQHAHYSLLRPEAQRSLLDGYGGLGALARAVAEHHRAWQKASAARRAAEANAEANAREREMLAWQVKELAVLGFEPADWAETNQEHRRLAHAATLLEGVEESLMGLGEGEFALLSRVAHVAARLQGLTDYDAALKDALEGVEGAQIQLQEAAHALRRYRDRLELDPQRLAEVEQRIEAVHGLARKHRVAPEDLPELLARWEARLAELEADQDPGALAEREGRARQDYLEQAGALSRERRRAAAALAGTVTGTMQQLALPGGRLDIVLTPLEEGTANGLESIEFIVSTHPGQPAGPLARVASGGELSRIGLAIQVAASSVGQAQTLVFDEVDVGIGGAVAEVVGRLLKQLGAGCQVLCVTHLPQVAAQADWQWSIAKEGAGDGVVSRVTPLDRAGRVEEIARMLGGVRITPTTRKHAAEMLGVRI